MSSCSPFCSGACASSRCSEQRPTPAASCRPGALHGNRRAPQRNRPARCGAPAGATAAPARLHGSPARRRASFDCPCPAIDRSCPVIDARARAQLQNPWISRQLRALSQPIRGGPLSFGVEQTLPPQEYKNVSVLFVRLALDSQGAAGPAAFSPAERPPIEHVLSTRQLEALADLAEAKVPARQPLSDLMLLFSNSSPVSVLATLKVRVFTPRGVGSLRRQPPPRLSRASHWRLLAPTMRVIPLRAAELSLRLL